MAGTDFSKLFRVLGGAEALAERVNALRDRMDASQDIKPLTSAAIYAWTQNGFPMGWRHWVLAAARDAGMTHEQAIKLCPDLKSAAALAHFNVKESA